MAGTSLEALVTSIEVEREQALKSKERAASEIASILQSAKKDGRPTLNGEEERTIKREFENHARAESDIAGIDIKLANARKLQRIEMETDLKLRDSRPVEDDGPTGGRDDLDVQSKRRAPAYDEVARIGAEKRTYNPGNCRKGSEFLADVIASYAHHDAESDHRLRAHMREERVERGEYLQKRANVGTSNFAGLVVPQYLTDLYAPAVAALRPFADVCNNHDLPENGMTVNISRITTTTSVGVQTEGNAALNTDIDDTLLTESVQTAAGYADLTRQAIERGTGVEEVTMDDLMRRYATSLDGTLLNQATTGLTNIAQGTTWDDTTPTVPELWPKFLGAMANQETALLGMAFPDYVVMHSRRWYWLQSYLSSTFPFIGQPGIPPQQAGVNNGNGYNQGVRGTLPNGMRVIVDNNIATNGGTGTNQDEIYVVASSECHLWEDPNAPVFIRAEQPLAHQLAVRLVLYGYFAYSFRRYANGQQKIAGTGLVPPSF
jgi:hypothetical protein